MPDDQTPADRPGTDRMVCFALYAAARATTQADRNLLAPWDLTYPQYLVLVTLWVEGPQTVRVRSTAEALSTGAGRVATVDGTRGNIDVTVSVSDD